MNTETASKRTKLGNQNFIQSIEWKVSADHSFTPQSLKAFLIDHEIVTNPRKRAVSFLQGVGLWSHILSLTDWMGELPVHSNVKFRIAYIMQDCPTIPHCKVCGNNCAWSDSGFSKWCGIKCRNKDPELNKILSEKQTANAEIRNKKRAITLAKQGKTSPFQGHRHSLQSREDISVASSRVHAEVKERNGGVHPMDLAINRHSKGEYEVRQTLIDFGVSENDIEIGNRKILNGKELDIYIPSKKFAIEYCGEFWHSEKGRPDKLHLFEKWKECKEKDIQLVCIFESEWVSRKYQIMNLLRSKLVPALKIPARKCEFTKLPPEDAKNFVNRYHIQPIAIMGDYTYGLVYDSEIVAVMTFRLHHRNSKDIVLNRFCCRDGISIIGGASKLLRNAMKLNNWSKVISWSDNRWSNGNLYNQLGFQLKAELKPDYMYWDGHKMLSKQSCTKKALKARSDQTESQRAEELGLCKIWDCGKQSWIFEQSTSLLMPYKGKIIVEKPIIKAPYIPLF